MLYKIILLHFIERVMILMLFEPFLFKYAKKGTGRLYPVPV